MANTVVIGILGLLLVIAIVLAVLGGLGMITPRKTHCVKCIGDAYDSDVNQSYKVGYTKEDGDTAASWGDASVYSAPSECDICGTPTDGDTYYISYTEADGWVKGTVPVPVSFDPNLVTLDAANNYLYDANPTCVRYGEPADGTCDPVGTDYHCSGAGDTYGTVPQQYNDVYSAFNAGGKYTGTTCT